MQWHAPQRLGQEAPDVNVWGPVSDQDVASAGCALGWLSRLLRDREREREGEREREREREGERERERGVRVSARVPYPAAPTRLLRAAALDVVRHHLVEAGRLSLVVLGFASGRRACLAPARM